MSLHEAAVAVIYPMVGAHNARQWSQRVVMVMVMVVVGREHLCLYLVMSSVWLQVPVKMVKTS